MLESEDDTICAFCLMTSAGVSMAHETSSAREDAAAWMTGVGSKPLGCEDVWLRDVKADLVRS